MSTSWGKPELLLLALAAALRLGMITFGEWQDRHMEVKYTDIDYEVFTDAAVLVAEGRTPFGRATFRYSPLLAFALLPNVLLFKGFGKLLFSAADLCVGYVLGLLTPTPELRPLAMALWLFNPFTFSIATRGNCESVICCALLSLLLCLARGQDRLWQLH